MKRAIEELIAEHQDNNKQYLYMTLDRMKQDCKYFLSGHNCNKFLYSGSIEEHIADMKAIYNSFEPAERPEWLDMQQIEEYNREMLAIGAKC